MLERIVKLFLRSRRIRSLVIDILAHEVRAQALTLRKADKRERRERNRTRPFCKDCVFFRRTCNSRNIKGWCQKWSER